MHVVIIGAGVSGLSAGAALVRAGMRVTILEKSSTVGGLAASFARNGYIFDLGPHIFFGKSVIAQLNRFFDAEKVIIENKHLTRAIYIHGKLFHYPFQPREVLRRIKKRQLLSVISEVIASNFLRGGECQTLEAWVKGKIGNVLFDYIELNTYVEKLYGISAAEISSDWGKHRLKPIANLNLCRALSRSLNPWAKKKKRYTYYCLAGIGEIADRLAGYVTNNGGEILLDSRVEKLQVSNGQIDTVLIKENGKPRTVLGDFVISSAKVIDLVKMIDPEPSPEILAAVDTLRYRDLIILYLVVEKSRIFDHCFVFFSTKDTTFKRITEFKHFSPKMVPEDLTSLAVEICANPGDDILKYEDAQLFEKVIIELQKLGIAEREEVLEYFTIKVPAAYPVYFLNYAEPLRVVLNDINKIKNLVSIGRRGLYQHDDMPSAIQSGFNLAELITHHGGHDLAKVGNIVYQERLQKYRNVS